MSAPISAGEVKIVSDAARRINDSNDFARLVGLAGRAQIVLIGEASHGTHEFYARRAQLTRQLIEDHAFRIVSLEADWPDTLRVHRYVSGRTEERDATEALGDFRR